MIQLRPYQQQIIEGVFEGWNAGNTNVIAVAPTGAGKTVVFSEISRMMNDYGCAIAHRQELVGQISRAHAAIGMEHNIIASKTTVAYCVSEHVKRFGRSFYNPNAPFAVAGVDTLNRRADQLRQWRNRVKFWTIDEAHHVLAGNKWGKALQLFLHARGLGVTATPIRADRKSLSRTQHGVFDYMVVGPSMRELINSDPRYLCDYQIFAPPESIDTSEIPLSNSGDFSPAKLSDKAKKSTIVGDLVQTYQRVSPGKRAIAFYVDVEQAIAGAQAFKQAGIRAEPVDAKTPDTVRQNLIDALGTGGVDVLTNVDLFGEGVDVPAVETVIMGRPTQSYGLYVQQFGRSLRLHNNKTHGIIIDHVGNVVRHGLPDAPRMWSLENEEYGKRSKRETSIQVKTCERCFTAYEPYKRSCPYCGHTPEPEGRSLPKQVDGDLIELTPDVLAAMRGEVAAFDQGKFKIPCGADDKTVARLSNLHADNQQAQTELRECIALWAGVEQQVNGLDDHEIYRKFYHSYGIDVMSAQTLKAKDARKLTASLRGTF